MKDPSEPQQLQRKKKQQIGQDSIALACVIDAIDRNCERATCHQARN